MRFTSIITFAAAFAGLIQALPIEIRGVSHLNGVSYNGRNSDGSCQTAAQVTAAVKKMKQSGINNIRTYSQQCNQLPAILSAIKSAGGGMTVLAAVWIDGVGDDGEISTLKTVLSSGVDTSPINGILVGNEVIFNNVMSSSALISKINTVRGFANGIPVGTADTDGTFPSDLMSASDFIGANIHPFFSDVSIGQAMDNLNQRYKKVTSAAGSKKVYITETGWPSGGNAAGAAVPSLANLESFATSISKSSISYYFFEWQDSDWKASGIESNFGLLYANGQSKFAI